jgi:hypothetical protein
MSKVKFIERKVTEKETQYDYPIYLYFQGESGDDECIMVEEDYQIKVKVDFLNVVIERGLGFAIEEHYLKNNLTTREHFLEFYNNAIDCFNKGTKLIKK